MKYKIRINGKILHLSGFLIVLLFMGVKCNKHKEEFIGPEYKLAASDFQVLAPIPPALKDFYMTVPPLSSRTTVDFSATKKDTIRFYANFNNRVTWFLDLKGMTSGAKKRFTGLSQQLQTEKELYWTGTSDDLIMFSSGENVEASLSFMGTALTLKDTVHITTKRSYSHVIKLVNDFEGAVKSVVVGSKTVTFPNNNLPPYWYNYQKDSTGSEINFLEVHHDLSILLADHRVPNGTHYFLLDGVDKDKAYFIEGLGFDKQKQIPAYHNPDSVYFNIYVYGFGIATAQFQIGFDEDDNLDGIYGDPNSPYSQKKPNPDTEDEYDYIVFVNWTGWRLLSFKYSETTVGISPNGSKGNHILEPHKIQKMGFGMNSNPSGGAAKVAFDYPVFTYGAPFDPNN